jgi:hypothetical protein
MRRNIITAEMIRFCCACYGVQLEDWPLERAHTGPVIPAQQH